MQGSDVLNTTKEYNSLDIFKFVLSIFVVVIHSEIDKTVISPLLRIAVPSFFLISSYLFFSKVAILTDKKERRSALCRLAKRNIFLYLFWVVLQLPLIIYGHHYHIDFFTKGIVNTLRIVILGQGFTGSWYIITLVIGSIIVYLASKKISAGWLVLLTLPLYIMCCIATNYRDAFGEESFLVQSIVAYEKATQSVFNTSLPGGLFWIAVGNYLARNPIRIKTHILNILLALLVVLIAAERFLIVKFNWQYLDDCYLTLIVLCPIIFILVRRYNFVFNSRFRFREMSTLIYVIHGSCGRGVGFLLKMGPLAVLQNEMVKVSLTIVVAVVASATFLALREKLKMNVLKYAC